MLHTLFRINDTPLMSRATYRLELAAIFFSTLGFALCVGPFCSYFARAAIEAPKWMIAAIISAGALGSMATSLISSHFSHLSQAKVAGYGRMAGGISIASVALLRLDQPWSPWLFTGLSLATATAMMITTHALTQIWKSNYPARRRGAIVSRTFIVQVSLTALLAWLAGRVLDVRPNYFRLLFATAGLAWMISGLFYMRIPVRGDGKRVAGRPTFRRNPFAPLSVLVSDRNFARYQFLQMVQGAACLGLGPVWTVVLSDKFNSNYTYAAAALMTIPLVMQVMMIPYLGGVFDRLSLFRFRCFGSSFWALSFVLMAVAILRLSPVLAMSSFVAMGIGQSFGRLAWSMGHMDFGDPRENLTYMSAHMMLTGLRGISMPFLGVYLYEHFLGEKIFWVAGAMLLSTAIAFRLWDPHAGRKQSYEALAGK